MQSDKTPTVAEGLGINEEWAIVNKYRALKWLEDSSEMSEAIVKAIQSVKTDEFGETDGKISVYERKLILTGMHLGEHVITRILTGWQNQIADLSQNLQDDEEL